MITNRHIAFLLKCMLLMAVHPYSRYQAPMLLQAFKGEKGHPFLIISMTGRMVAKRIVIIND